MGVRVNWHAVQVAGAGYWGCWFCCCWGKSARVVWLREGPLAVLGRVGGIGGWGGVLRMGWENKDNPPGVRAGPILTCPYPYPVRVSAPALAGPWSLWIIPTDPADPPLCLPAAPVLSPLRFPFLRVP